jgi:hypothetical protein
VGEEEEEATPARIDCVLVSAAISFMLLNCTEAPVATLLSLLAPPALESPSTALAQLERLFSRELPREVTEPLWGFTIMPSCPPGTSKESTMAGGAGVGLGEGVDVLLAPEGKALGVEEVVMFLDAVRQRVREAVVVAVVVAKGERVGAAEGEGVAVFPLPGREGVGAAVKVQVAEGAGGALRVLRRCREGVGVAEERGVPVELPRVEVGEVEGEGEGVLPWFMEAVGEAVREGEAVPFPTDCVGLMVGRALRLPPVVLVAVPVGVPPWFRVSALLLPALVINCCASPPPEEMLGLLVAEALGRAVPVGGGEGEAEGVGVPVPPLELAVGAALGVAAPAMLGVAAGEGVARVGVGVAWWGVGVPLAVPLAVVVGEEPREGVGPALGDTLVLPECEGEAREERVGGGVREALAEGEGECRREREGSTVGDTVAEGVGAMVGPRVAPPVRDAEWQAEVERERRGVAEAGAVLLQEAEADIVVEREGVVLGLEEELVVGEGERLALPLEEEDLEGERVALAHREGSGVVLTVKGTLALRVPVELLEEDVQGEGEKGGEGVGRGAEGEGEVVPLLQAVGERQAVEEAVVEREGERVVVPQREAVAQALGERVGESDVVGELKMVPV